MERRGRETTTICQQFYSVPDASQECNLETGGFSGTRQPRKVAKEGKMNGELPDDKTIGEIMKTTRKRLVFCLNHENSLT